MIPKDTLYCNLSTEEAMVYSLFSFFWLVDPWFLGSYLYSHANSPFGACPLSVTCRDRWIYRGVSWIQYRSRIFYPIRISKVPRSTTLRLRNEAFCSLDPNEEESVLHIGEPYPPHHPSNRFPTFYSIRERREKCGIGEKGKRKATYKFKLSSPSPNSRRAPGPIFL